MHGTHPNDALGRILRSCLYFVWGVFVLVACGAKATDGKDKIGGGVESSGGEATPSSAGDACDECERSADCATGFCNRVSSYDLADAVGVDSPVRGYCSEPGDRGTCDCGWGTSTPSGICVGVGCPSGDPVELCYNLSGSEYDATPETMTPETMTPETTTPETTTPETMTPETMTPETMTPETTSDDPQSCPVFQACGGDPTGTWAIRTMCVNDASDVAAASFGAGASECASAFQAVEADATGTYAFDATGSGVQDVLFSFAIAAVFSHECFEALAEAPLTSTEFEQFCDALPDELASSGIYESVSCGTSGGSCLCSLASAPTSSIQTYSVQADTLVTPDGATTWFCVQGDTLTIADDAANPASVLVLERQ